MWSENTYAEKIKIVTLKSICENYIPQNQTIHFLKIDVEGAEKQVLLGADFQAYRPWIVVIEATKPMTDVPCFDDWEYLLLSKGYHFVQMTGVNRYYVADEKEEFDKKILQKEELERLYEIYYIDIE